MDQDYSPADIFRLMQRQRSHSLSEELVFKGSKSLPSYSSLKWTAGAYLGYQSLHTNAPVTFGQAGIQQLIQAGIDQGFAAANAAMNPMGMSLALNITDEQLGVAGRFDTPVLNAASFGQLQFINLFTQGLDFTAGLRLDYEHRSMDYLSGTTLHSNFSMMRGGNPMMNQDFTTYSGYEGKLSDNQTRLLPKFVLSYRFGGLSSSKESRDGFVYFSVSEGFRSGGYNIQMFSDLIQASMRNDLMGTRFFYNPCSQTLPQLPYGQG